MGTSTTSALSLGRVVPAPHTQHLLGPFAAIAQNSSLWRFSIVDSLANRQHSRKGSEELAIRKTARFQATPSYSELLRVGGAQELRATPFCFEPLRATPSCSEWRPRTPSYYQDSQFESTSVSHCNPRNSEWRRKNSESLRAIPSHSKLLRPSPSGAQELRAITSVPHCSIHLISPRSYSERGAPKNSELLRGLRCELHRTLSGNCRGTT